MNAVVRKLPGLAQLLILTVLAWLPGHEVIADGSVSIAITADGEITVAGRSAGCFIYGVGDLADGYSVMGLNGLPASSDRAHSSSCDPSDAGGGTGIVNPNDAGGGTGIVNPHDAGGGTGIINPRDAGGGTGIVNPHDAGGGTGIINPNDAGGGTGVDASWGYAEVLAGCGQADVIVYRSLSNGALIEIAVTSVPIEACL